MGDLETLAKARRELQDLYLGVPDDSVNLSFQELANLTQRKSATFSSQLSPHKKSPPSAAAPAPEPPSLAKIPSLDFSRALEASVQTHRHHDHQLRYDHHHQIHQQQHQHQEIHHQFDQNRHHVHVVGNDDMSGMTMGDVSTAATPYRSRRQRRRPGIPHSNICTVCTTYIYVFRYRCLVCGRVYCRQCVGIGMGDMAEGRKCVDCLGRRFSQRYIHKAGQMGCCMGYPSIARQQELIWAEKGPSQTRDNQHGRSSAWHHNISNSTNIMMSSAMTPTRAHIPNAPPSFVMNSPHSPYTPTRHHPLPF